jgi:hypothetical protein
MMNRKRRILQLLSCLSLLMAAALPVLMAQDIAYSYRVLATQMNEAADAGYIFSATMGGETAFGGNEAVVVMIKDPTKSTDKKRIYKLLATSKTSTMQKEMQQFGDEGYEYRGQTVFKSTFGGKEVCVIMERDTAQAVKRIQYKLLATSKTSTMQKELQEAGGAGCYLVGMTVAKTAFGGDELVCILRK